MCCIIVLWSGYANAQEQDSVYVESDTTELPIKATRPEFRAYDRHSDALSNPPSSSPFFLKDPSTLKLGVKIDSNMRYHIREDIGKVRYRPPTTLPFRDYDRMQERSMFKNYWQKHSKAMDGETAVKSRWQIPKIPLSPTLDRIFGGDHISFDFRGFLSGSFGGAWQRVENPNIPARQQSSGGFEFHEQINMSVTGKVGEKLKMTASFETNNTFNFQNRFKVEFTGFKEDIIKKIEFGNVSLPLNNSLITGAQNLFGAKAQFQFGKWNVTALASTQRGKQSSIKVNTGFGGASQGRPFEIQGSNYDENRNFFLGQFFRDNFEIWLGTLPQITSGVNITRVEVYVVNRQNDTQTQRNVVGLMDLGESDKIYRQGYYQQTTVGSTPTDNRANNLLQLALATSLRSESIANELDNLLGGGAQKLESGIDYEQINSARKLDPSEYVVNKQLGYITLQRRLNNDEALAVAYQYTYNGQVYKVGEMSEDYSVRTDNTVALLKLLRPKKISIKDLQGNAIPTWHLMMKNVYNLNISGISREGFQLRIIYRDDRTGIDNPQLQEGSIARSRQLVQVFGLDRLNPYNDPTPDGNFDFVEGVTVFPETGIIVFPYLEPFDKPLRQIFDSDTDKDFLINKYIYNELYQTTKAEAQLVATKNKFFIVGSLKSGSGREVAIQGFNIAPGSVKVFSGGTPLAEGQDYRVDYTLGKVTFLNEAILNSGREIEITYEQQDLFAFQTRSLLGTRIDYKFSDDINFGSTLLYYNERPVITRQAIGAEPSRNFQYGLDVNLKKNSRFITRMVDKLPFLETKEASNITVNAEFAQLLPGTSNTIDGEGTSFIDDFEQASRPNSLMNVGSWKLASVPKDFDITNGTQDNVMIGNKRAKMAWYQIDPLFYRENDAFRPANLSSTDMENHYVRRVLQQEIFPLRDRTQILANEPIFDISYYPEERGPYNYSADQTIDGNLRNPIGNWAGITTAIRTEVDFDNANVEYIEFWLLDPFLRGERGRVMDGRLNANNTTGGKLVFQLGSISEDIMRDNKFFFENGLQPDGSYSNSSPNAWGFVTNQQFVNNAFDSSPAARANQDVGLDGINDTREAQQFSPFLASLNPQARQIALTDPSADNFRFPINGYYDDRNAKVLERYKDYNGVENNSPAATAAAYSTSGTNIPDTEDLNQDNTLATLEEYYQFNVDLTPGNLDVGKKYIVDKITPLPDLTGGEPVTWYLFRIPVRQFDEKVGNIADFKSIKYMRMYMHGFSQPVVLRMANFRTVGNQWRRYTATLNRDNFSEELEPNLDNFSVSTVNIEENGAGSANKPAYVPPLARDYDNTSTVRRRLNEQSVQLSVSGLQDGDSRSIYKNTSVDMFNYRRLKMFFSANTNNPVTIPDNEIAAFLRLGTDFDQNYFEIEVPLKITPNGTTVDTGVIWPSQNEIDLALDELYAIKLARDREGYPLSAPYPQSGAKRVGHHRLRVLGRPDLSSVRLMMIGVRNIKSPDGRAYDVNLWADELRVTDFDRTPGLATNIVTSVKLANLGTVNGSFRYTGFGYGNVQTKIAERARGETAAYNFSGNISVDKLLPKFLSLSIPVYASYGRTVTNPNFDPANPDVRIAATMKSFETDDERNAYRSLIQDEMVQRSFNVTNFKKIKLKKDAKNHIWDVENLSFTYAFSESKRTNFNIKENTQRTEKGAVAWQYNADAKGFTPFSKSKAFSSPYLRFIKDFNINLVPNTITVRADLDRSFSKLVYRNQTTDAASSIPNYQKYLVMNRNYNVQWQLTQSLALNYSAVANAIIDEPDGDIDTQKKKDSIWSNLKKLGRMKNFQQVMSANYELPFSKFLLTDWISATAKYSATYQWKAGPLEKNPDLQLGNVLSNLRMRNITGRIDFLRIYNKSKFLQKINSGNARTPSKNPSNAKENVEKKSEEQLKINDMVLLKGILRLLMTVRNATFSYDVNDGTILPGYNQTPSYFGLTRWSAPGVGFIFGFQDYDLAARAAKNGWLVANERLTTPFNQQVTRDFNFSVNLEPTPNLILTLSGRKSVSDNFQQIFRYNSASRAFEPISPNRSGSYKVSFISAATAFKNNASLQSSVYNQFQENIEIIRRRFQDGTSNTYEKQAQDVLIPAFIAAYSGQSASKVSLASFPSFPLPNWRIEYTGIGKIPALREKFQSIRLSHAYSSTYSVNNYNSSLDYSNAAQFNLSQAIEDYNRYGFAQIIDGKLVPMYVLGQLVINESFSPLVGINIRTKNNLSIDCEYTSKRDVGLNVSNAQITEAVGKNWRLQLDYTKSDLRLPFRDKGRVITIKNEIKFGMSISYTTNSSIQRKIGEDGVYTNGNINFQIRPNITYAIRKNINIQAYFERNVNTPLITTSYRRANTNAGLKLTISFSQ